MVRRRTRTTSTDHAAGVRIELAPMIDVIFVLLTFFIYSVVRMINAGPPSKSGWCSAWYWVPD